MYTITEINNIAQANTSVFKRELNRRNIYGLIFSSKKGMQIRHVIEEIDVFEVNRDLLLTSTEFNTLHKAAKRGNFTEYEMFLYTLNLYYRYGNERATEIMMYLSKLASMKWKYRREAIITLALFQFVQAFETRPQNRKKLFTQIIKTLNSIDKRDEDDLVYSIYGLSCLFVGDYKKGKKYLEKVEIKSKMHYNFLGVLKKAA